LTKNILSQKQRCPVKKEKGIFVNIEGQLVHQKEYNIIIIIIKRKGKVSGGGD